jgi:hypothetical protein
MGDQDLAVDLRWVAARTLAIDQVTSRVVHAFAEAGIVTLVLKGPVLAEWLYPGEVRPYGDSDLMVAPEHWTRAVRLLEEMGFADYLGPMKHPRMESLAGTGFQRNGTEHVDLHCALHGLDGDPAAIWASFEADSELQLIGGAHLRIPGRTAVLLHIVLHAAHHPDEAKPLEDLRRAIARADESHWRGAVALARAHQGVGAFASGLQSLPEGGDLARRLEIEGERSTRHDLRRQGIPMAEGIAELFSSKAGTRAKLALVLSELFPRPEFIRWWLPLARRGHLGLAVGYLWRPVWLLIHAPRGVLAWWRVRR